jgi:hypothetical protein
LGEECFGGMGFELEVQRWREGLESGLGVGERNGSRFGNRNRRRSAILTSGKGLFEACYDLGYVMAIELLSCGIEL